MRIDFSSPVAPGTLVWGGRTADDGPLFCIMLELQNFENSSGRVKRWKCFDNEGDIWHFAIVEGDSFEGLL